MLRLNFRPLIALLSGVILLNLANATAAPAVNRLLLKTDPSLCRDGGLWLSVDRGAARPLSTKGVIAEAALQDVVLLGEQHDLEDHHRWQLQVLAALHAQRPDLVIGFEMFPRQVQPVLDRWIKGELTAPAFLAEVKWEKIWSFPPQLYLPLFEFARLNRIPLLALNVDQRLTQSIADKGWVAVPAELREGVGRAAPPSADYRRFLREIHEAHNEVRASRQGKGKGVDSLFENFVDAQQTWDRAMAEALAGRLKTGERRPLMIGVMGSGHIRFGHGVPHQLRDLGVSRIASLLPLSSPEACRELQVGLADAVFVFPAKPLPAIEPPRLGVQFADEQGRLQILAVTPGSLAEKTGLKAGDRLLELAGRPVSSSAAAVAIIRRQPPGTWLPLRIARQEEQMELLIRFPAAP